MEFIMGMYVPQMQRAWTGYDAGKNIANNLLEAVKMNREYEHKSNVMDMEQEKLDLWKQDREYDKGITRAQREADDIMYKQFSERNKEDALLLRWENQKKKYINTELADQDWFNPRDWVTGREDLGDEFEKTTPMPESTDAFPDPYSQMPEFDGIKMQPSRHLQYGMENTGPRLSVEAVLEKAKTGAIPIANSPQEEFENNMRFREELRNYNSLLDITPQGF